MLCRYVRRFVVSCAQVDRRTDTAVVNGPTDRHGGLADRRTDTAVVTDRRTDTAVVTDRRTDTAVVTYRRPTAKQLRLPSE